MTLSENCVTTRKVILRDRGERLEYIRNASTSHAEERLDVATVQDWIVDVLAMSTDDTEHNERMAYARAELLAGSDKQWDECVNLWSLESEGM
jgi:hypothetical protein